MLWAAAQDTFGASAGRLEFLRSHGQRQLVLPHFPAPGTGRWGRAYGGVPAVSWSGRTTPTCFVRPATNGERVGRRACPLDRGLSLSDAVAADNAIETDRAMGHAGVWRDITSARAETGMDRVWR